MNKVYQRAYLILIILILTGCLGNRRDNRLAHVQEIVAILPDSALVILDSIDPTTLTTSDRHLYDFLTIKAGDKAYVRHQSDSLILDVLDYYSSHQAERSYPEALYYAGRVYSDLGDKPTALRYFQQALDKLPAEGDSTSLDMRCTVLSQTARLLTSLRLYDEAISYLHESNKIEKQLNDTLSIIQDLQLLGWNLFKIEKYDSAEKVLTETFLYGVNQKPSVIAKSKVYLAATKYHKGDIDSALCLIRNTYSQVNPRVRNNALGFGVDIYLQANILDTAFLLAKELVASKDDLNKKIGYAALLSPELESYLTPELQKRYISEYRALLESFLDEDATQLAVTQEAFYNYQLHERRRIKAEESNMKLWRIMVTVSFITLLLLIIVLYLKNQNKTRLINLQRALDNIRLLNEELKMASDRNKDFPEMAPDRIDKEPEIAPDRIDKEPEMEEVVTGDRKNMDINFEISEDRIQNNGSMISEEETAVEVKTEPTVETLKRQLIANLISLSEKDPTPKLSQEIYESQAYQKLKSIIQTKKGLKDSDPLWIELEKIVIKVSPNFKKRLELLTGERLTTIGLRTAILIKCHLSLSQMATLSFRSKSSIGSRRSYLGVKIFGEKMPSEVIDSIIRNL